MADVEFAEVAEEIVFIESIELRKLKNAPLMDILCGAIVPDCSNIEGTSLEKNLATVAACLGFEETRKVFRAKLLIPSENSLQDVCYEAAVAARACDVLDPGSVQLEFPIENVSRARKDLKNSDIYGTFKGQRVRIEVTVLHEKPPSSVDAELTYRLECADVASGFDIKMRAPLKTDNETNDAIALLQLLHECHIQTGGATVSIDNIEFIWRHSSYQGGPFEKVVFHPADDKYSRGEIRRVSHASKLRRRTPKYISQDYPNPKRVFEFRDDKAPEPVSKKIRDRLEEKLAQCEEGIVNLIAFGNPHRKDEGSLRDALFGALIPAVQLGHDQNGVYHILGKRLYRAPRAPFNPHTALQSDDDRERLINSFKILSGVWHIRLGLRPLSKVIPNPNASTTVPMELSNALSGAA